MQIELSVSQHKLQSTDMLNCVVYYNDAEEHNEQEADSRLTRAIFD